jgi:hypothetical protein
MPRYYFDVHNGETSTTDTVGLEFDGRRAAQREAVRCLPQLAKDALPDGTERDFVVVVRDDAGRAILRAKLSLTVETLL